MRPTRIKDIDFKPRSAPTRRNVRIKHLQWLALGLSGVAGVTLLFSGQQEAGALRDSGTTAATLNIPLSLPGQAPADATAGEQPLAPAAPLAPDMAAGENREEVADTAATSAVTPDPILDENWKTVVVKSGDTLAKIFSEIGLDAKTMYSVLNAGEAARTLVRIYPGNEIRFLIQDNSLKGIRFPVDESVTLHVDSGEDGFEASLVATPLERRTAHAVGTITSSLFEAGKAAGLNDGVIMELAGIFGWDIDFALDIRAGDRFAVVYEEIYRNGEMLRQGNIIAAEFVNQNRTYRAVAYTDPDGKRDFYAPDGRSMRKAFLRSPVDFRRISSGFNPNRLHPVLGTKRPHRGVDYAAPTNTPIVASGDGKIVHLGNKGGYGKTIIIQHGSRYSTLYAHMNGYKSGLKVGSRVRQGQVIGYVGSTGLATGPHLHYEFLVDGVHRNPLTVDLPGALPISKELLADFQEKTAPLLAQLDVISRSQLALQQPPTTQE